MWVMDSVWCVVYAQEDEEPAQHPAFQERLLSCVFVWVRGLCLVQMCVFIMLFYIRHS
jgi:hypothetical protein